MSRLAELVEQALIDQREHGIQPLSGKDVFSVPRPGRPDLSDWLELMEVVEALCPIWPERAPEKYGMFKL